MIGVMQRQIQRPQTVARREALRARAIGEPVSIITAATMLVVGWLAGALTAAGVSAAIVATISTCAASIVYAGIIAGVAKVYSLVDEYVDGASDAAKEALKYKELWAGNEKFESYEKVLEYTAELKRGAGSERAGEMKAMKAYSRYKQVHEPLPVFIELGIGRNADDIRNLIQEMNDQKTGNAVAAMQFEPDFWYSYMKYQGTDDRMKEVCARVIRENPGLNGKMRAIRLWNYWKNSNVGIEYARQQEEGKRLMEEAAKAAPQFGRTTFTQAEKDANDAARRAADAKIAAAKAEALRLFDEQAAKEKERAALIKMLGSNAAKTLIKPQLNFAKIAQFGGGTAVVSSEDAEIEKAKEAMISEPKPSVITAPTVAAGAVGLGVASVALKPVLGPVVAKIFAALMR